MSTPIPAPARATSRKFAFVGLTDEVTDCELCGKPNLKRTVVLLPLDQDGGADGEAHFYGTACAALALGWSHGTDDPHHRRASDRVLREARAAQARQDQSRADAAERLAFWGPFEHADHVALWALWRTRNPYGHDTDPRIEVPRIIADARAVLGIEAFQPDIPVWAAAYLDWHTAHEFEADPDSYTASIAQGFRVRAAERARRTLAAAGLCRFAETPYA